MDIPWYKNHWYWLALGTGTIIVVGSLYLTTFDMVVVGASTTDVQFLANVAARALFNPAWLICVWLYNNGKKMNSKKHRDILLHLEGIVAAAHDSGQETILTRTLARVLVKSHDIESTITEVLHKGVSVGSEGGSPVA